MRNFGNNAEMPDSLTYVDWGCPKMKSVRSHLSFYNYNLLLMNLTAEKIMKFIE